MNRIITRGMGANNMLVARGYGLGVIQRLREIMQLCSRIAKNLFLTTDHSDEMVLYSPISTVMALTSDAGDEEDS